MAGWRDKGKWREPEIVRVANVDTSRYHNIRKRLDERAISEYAAKYSDSIKEMEAKDWRELKDSVATPERWKSEAAKIGISHSRDPFPPRIIGRRTDDGTMVLIDGYHRLEAVKKAWEERQGANVPLPEDYRVKAYVVNVENEEEISFLSGYLNSQHGVPLKGGEKKQMAVDYLRAKQYLAPLDSRTVVKSQAVMAKELGISKGTIQKAISEIPKLKGLYEKRGRLKKTSRPVNNPEGLNRRKHKRVSEYSEKYVIVMGMDKDMMAIMQGLQFLPYGGTGIKRTKAQLALLQKCVEAHGQREDYCEVWAKGMRRIQKKYPVETLKKNQEFVFLEPLPKNKEAQAVGIVEAWSAKIEEYREAANLNEFGEEEF
jgi:hypothetical protein